MPLPMQSKVVTEKDQQEHAQIVRMLETMKGNLNAERWAPLFENAMAIAEYARNRAYAEHKEVFGVE